jgi:hypothetical protein
MVSLSPRDAGRITRVFGIWQCAIKMSYEPYGPTIFSTKENMASIESICRLEQPRIFQRCFTQYGVFVVSPFSRDMLTPCNHLYHRISCGTYRLLKKDRIDHLSIQWIWFTQKIILWIFNVDLAILCPIMLHLWMVCYREALTQWSGDQVEQLWPKTHGRWNYLSQPKGM